MNAKVLVCTHKPCDLPSDDIYTPIHVGKVLSDLDFGFIGDDTGDNISAKNPNYCELTAQYWAWKNLECDYIGLEHYRRHFACKFTPSNIEKLMQNVDIILPRPLYYNLKMYQKLESVLTREDVAIFYKILQKNNSDMTIVDRYLMGNMDVRYNIFFAKKELFDRFAEFQFDILSQCEKYIRLSPYVRLRRIYGYFGEILLPIWVFNQRLKIKYLPIEPNDALQSNSLFGKIGYDLAQSKNKYLGEINLLLHSKFSIQEATLTSLAQDQIFID